jgi:hypothetical protein
MGRAQGERDEARRAMGEAYQRLAGREALLIETTAQAMADEQRLASVLALLAEFEADLQAKGEEWHPRFRSAVEKVVDQLAAVLAGPPAETAADQVPVGGEDAAPDAASRQ